MVSGGLALGLLVLLCELADLLAELGLEGLQLVHKVGVLTVELAVGVLQLQDVGVLLLTVSVVLCLVCVDLTFESIILSQDGLHLLDAFVQLNFHQAFLVFVLEILLLDKLVAGFIVFELL